MNSLPPCVLHEDEHLLVVNKPPGWNTHSPSPYAGEGIYEWLKHREPRWANLAIIHRLDKETSGVLVFGKTPLANKSLTEQFERREVRKRYVLWTDRPLPQLPLKITSTVARHGDRYLSEQGLAGSDVAETHFLMVEESEKHHPQNLTVWIEAQPENPSSLANHRYNACIAKPLTGKTHQIRVHAAESGFPILGDSLYGGTAFQRVCLHAERLTLKHPASGGEVTYFAPVDFSSAPHQTLRSAVIEFGATTAFRVIHGASDGCPGLYVERFDDLLLSQGDAALSEQMNLLSELCDCQYTRGLYHKQRRGDVRGITTSEASPKLVIADACSEKPPSQHPSEEIVIRENGIHYAIRLNEGYSVGLFLDQRDNRRRLLVNHVGAKFPLFENGMADKQVLNTFAYTCAFSVCAAKAGAITTSLDLSKKYLDWGRRNFELNGLDPKQHDFIFGDCFDWMKRLAKKGRQFDLVLLDPPTFSQSKQSGVWRAEKDYGKLVTLALPLVKAGGVLFASTNAATLKPEVFLGMIEAAIHKAGRRILQQHYVSQTPDFPITREEPAYLKTVWLRVQ